MICIKVIQSNSVYDPTQYLVYELNNLIQNNIEILFDKKCLNQC